MWAYARAVPPPRATPKRAPSVPDADPSICGMLPARERIQACAKPVVAWPRWRRSTSARVPVASIRSSDRSTSSTCCASALKRERVGHAYLFSGPRGVGKTTTARLLAMAVNCDADDPAERPCGTCESCVLVQTRPAPGRHRARRRLEQLGRRRPRPAREGAPGLAPRRPARLGARRGPHAVARGRERAPQDPRGAAAGLDLRARHDRAREAAGDGAVAVPALPLPAAHRRADPRQAGAPGRRGRRRRRRRRAGARRPRGRRRDARRGVDARTPPRRRREGAPRGRARPRSGCRPASAWRRSGRAVLDGAWDALLDEAGALYRDGFAPRTVAEQLGRSLRDRLFAVGARGARATPTPLPLLMRALDALDAMSERFVRQNDLYALEVALLRTAAAATGARPRRAAVEDEDGAVAAPAPSAGAAPARAPARTPAPAPAPAAPGAPRRRHRPRPRPHPAIPRRANPRRSTRGPPPGGRGPRATPRARVRASRGTPPSPKRRRSSRPSCSPRRPS